MPHKTMQDQAPKRDNTLPIQWLSELQGLHERLKPCFPSRDTWSRAGAYLVGVLSGAERKNTWQMSEEIGEATPYALQHLLGRGKWDADCVRNEVRTYAYEHLANPQGVLILDETGFLKKGTKSVGVSRQYTGTAGRIENSQVGVFLAYASPKGHALIDRALYLPEDWAKDQGRRKDAGVPEAVSFHTKSRLGQQMLERAFEAGIPHTWVTADEVYGRDGSGLRHWLESVGVPYVMATAANQYVWLLDGQYRASNILKVSRSIVIPHPGSIRNSPPLGKKGDRVVA